MTAKIKLNAASGGGSFSLQAPSSSSNNRVITLPDIADGTLLTSQSTGLGKILQVKGSAQAGTTTSGFITYADNNINNTAALIGSQITINRLSASSYFLITVCALVGRASTSGWGYLGYTASFAGGSSFNVEVNTTDNENNVRHKVEFINATSGSVGDAVVLQARYNNSAPHNDNVRQPTITVMEYQP
tara:strand:+ start:111 stop:674 length:564 start_codon:yes stop_codon:yes gene_type:complete